MGWISDLGEAAGDHAPSTPLPRLPHRGTCRSRPRCCLSKFRRPITTWTNARSKRSSRVWNRRSDSAPEETAEIVAVAGRRSAEAVSLYEFTRLVDRSLAKEHKATIIELLFRVAFADGWLAGEEEHVIRQVATLLHVEHPAFIAAKLRAKG